MCCSKLNTNYAGIYFNKRKSLGRSRSAYHRIMQKAAWQTKTNEQTTAAQTTTTK